MLQIANKVKAFLEKNLSCEEEHDDIQPAAYLALCSYSYKPHVKAICKECIDKLERTCECGSGAISSGQISSVLDLKGVERPFYEFQ